MGIPGVQRQAQQLSKKHRTEFLAGGDFYVDGMNFAQRISTRSDSSGTQDRAKEGRIVRKNHESPYARGCRHVDRELEKLFKLQPHSITVVIDSMIGEEKFTVRIGRAESRLRKSEGSMNANELLAERITTYYPRISLIYSGTEAEDEIMKLIDESKDRGGRRQFVFSSDTDVYRFHVRDAELVEIIPLIGQKLNKRQLITTINLKTALDANIVPKSKRVFPPIERLGVSTVNPKLTSRKFFEFINCGNVHHRFFISLGPMLIPGYTDTPFDWSPFDAGEEIRRSAYGYIMNNYFAERPEVDTTKVEEWRQNGFKMEPVNVEPLRGEPLNLCLKLLTETPLAELVENQLEAVAKKYLLSDHDIHGVGTMINDLITDRLRRPKHLVRDWTHRLFTLVKAIFRSLTFLNQALEIKPEIKGMEMKVSVHHLESYLPIPKSEVHKSKPSNHKGRPKTQANEQNSVIPAKKESSPPTKYLDSLRLQH